MSLKTTPRGLLAALAALCIVLLQLPAMMGNASAASAGALRAAAPARHSVAAHAAAIKPHAIAPRDQTIGPSANVTFTNTTTNTANVSPIALPAGAPITVSGTISPTTPVTVTFSGSGATAASTLGSTTSNAAGAFSVNGLLPATITGTVTLTATVSPTQTATLTASINAPTLTISGGGTASSDEVLGTSSPLTATHCSTFTVTGANFAPGVAISPTLVYTSGGVTSTVVLTNVTPISDGSASEGNFSASVSITNAVAYSTTAVVSTSAQTPSTLPTVFVEPRPVLNTSSTDVSGAGGVLNPGPLGPAYVAGMTNTVNIVSSGYVAGTSGTFLGDSPISLTLGLSGTAGTPITPTAAVTTDSTGVFTASVPFSVPVAGTYVLTASDNLGSCNVATTTITVVSPSVPGAPVSTTYFPEGYTGQGSNNGKATFRTTLNLLNPNVSTVIVTDTYILEQGSSDVTPTTTAPDVVVVTHTLPALADQVIDVAGDIQSQPVITGPDATKVVSGTNQRVATIVQTAGFQGVGALAGLGGEVRGVAAERIIERNNNSGQRLDGDVSLGTTSASTNYYFAEGYTGFQFQEYLLLLNPSPKVTATVTVLRVPEGTATALPPLGPIVLAPYQRLTINVRRLNATSPENKIGLIVSSADNPIVAERVEYFGQGDGSAKPGESIAAGVTTAAKQLNFAFGSLTTAAITDATSAGLTPSSDLAQTLDDRPFIEVMNPNIAGQVIAGTTSGTAAAPGPAAHVTIQLRGEDGRLVGFFITDVDAGARFTLSYNDLTSSSGGVGFPGVPQSAPTRAGVFSTIVSSSDRVVAELAQYFGQGSFTPSGDANSGAPGIDLVGAPSGETDVLFPALGETDPASSLPLSNTVFLYNPGVNPVRINGTFYGANGVVAHQSYEVGPDAIQVIGQNSAFSGGSAGGSPIPAGTIGAEFSTIQERGTNASGEPGQAPEAFVAAAVTHSADGSQWWGTQGFYPLPAAPSCSNANGAPLPGGCP